MKPNYVDPDNSYFISDTHFGHRGIIRMCRRPFNDTDEMDSAMIKGWNAVVPKDANVFHLGDVSFLPFAHTIAVLGALNGRITLVAGNHDHGFLKKEIFRTFFHEIRDIKEINMEGTKVVMCHYPMESWNGMHHNSIHLHGHSHGNMPDFGRRLDVGVDATRVYAPMPYREIERKMKNRIIESRDHHNPDRVGIR